MTFAEIVGVGMAAGVVVLALWKRAAINAWLATWRVKDASVDAKVFKANFERAGQPDPRLIAAGTQPPAATSTPLPPVAVRSDALVPTHTPAPQGADPMDESRLRDQMTQLFDLEELRTLCFDLGVDFDSLRGEGKAAKARELVALMRRDNRLPELIARCAAQRPRVDWHLPAASAPLRPEVTQRATGGSAIEDSAIRVAKESSAKVEQSADDHGVIKGSGISIE